MNKLKTIVGFASIALLSQTALADGHVGGGNWTEAKIKNRMQDLIPYFYSPQGKLDFTEIEKYDAKHPDESFAQVIQNTAPVLWDGPKQLKFNGERDCVANVEKNNRWFKCNANALPDYDQDAVKDDNKEGDFNRFWFHEALVQADLESGRDLTVLSTYLISSRLEFHLETFQKLMPGKAEIPEKIEMLSDTGLFCTDEASRSWSKDSLIFVWKPNGDYLLIEQRLPAFQKNYGMVQYQISTKRQEDWSNFRHKFFKAISGEVTHTVLSRGNSMSILARTANGYSLGSSALQSDNESSFGFMVQTSSYLDETPAFNGRSTEIVMHFSTGMKHFKNRTMTCSSDPYINNLVPTAEIFKNKDQTLFKKNYIKTNHNPEFDK